jgi:hypothetical protein
MVYMSKRVDRKPNVFLTFFFVITVISLLLCLGYFFFKQRSLNNEVVWKESNWKYRKSIEVVNTENRKLKEYVYPLTLDTKDYIEKGKMKVDCSDIRFLDSDEKFSLEYEIREGCNTENTVIDISIPEIPLEGKIIYLFYGNPEAVRF